MSTTEDTKIVRITVRSAHSLVKEKLSFPGQPDPYAVVLLDNNQSYTTKPVKGTLNPTWNEHFDITITGSSTITIRVYYEGALRRKTKFPGSSPGLPPTVEQPRSFAPASPQHTRFLSSQEAGAARQDDTNTPTLSCPAEHLDSLPALSQEQMNSFLLPRANSGQQNSTVPLPELELHSSTPSTTYQQSQISSIQQTVVDEQNDEDASTTPIARVEDQLLRLASHAPLYSPPAITALQEHTDQVLTSLPLLERSRTSTFAYTFRTVIRVLVFVF
ncbi:hypothetical protein EDC04DRAFT_914061 [Pisolithus marmoratus]|nr:hypothetical protein EDC04DRAFT_914061 [Pisolithus marmoratus]